MKRLAIAAFGLLLAAGCSSSTTSTAPSTTGAGTTNTRFLATLSPAQEVPAVANAESTGGGIATIDMSVTRDASGTITAASTIFSVNMQNLQAASAVIASHIHTGAAGVAGPVLVNTTVTPGEVALTSGTGTFTRVGIATPVATAQSIIDNPAGYYFNVHTTLNPSGVMRGQLVKQ